MSKKAETFYIAAVSLALLILGCIKGYNPYAMIIGILSILVEFILIYSCLKIEHVKLCKKDTVFLGAVIFIILLYLYVACKRDIVYTWDWVNYYNRQLRFVENCDVGLGYTLSTWLGSMTGGYTDFLVIFTVLPFMFSNRTVQAYIVICGVFQIVPAVFMWYCISRKLVEKNRIHYNGLIYITIFLSTFVMIHRSGCVGMPDAFGLLFCGLIALLTMDYDFQTFDSKRLICIFLATAMLIITRRAYMFWVVGYYFCYTIACIIMAYKDKEIKHRMKNLIVFGTISVCSLAVIYKNIWKSILDSNFTNQFVGYESGGPLAELKHQSQYIGWALVVVLLIGLFWGMIKDFKYTLLFFCTGLVSGYSLIQINEMGIHQALVIVPTYIIFFVEFIVLTYKMKYGIYFRIMATVILMLNLYGGISENPLVYDNKLFTNISFKMESREDMKQIGEIVEWINDNCNNDDIVYINCTCALYGGYDEQLFNNYNLPVRNENRITGVVNTFPLNFFDAKYVFVQNPNSDYLGGLKAKNICPIITDSIENDPVISKRFKFVESWNMKSNLEIYCYERIASVDSAEIDILLDKFSELGKEDPDAYIAPIIYWKETYLTE